MKVHILLKIDSWEVSEILGVFTNPETAKEFARNQEPDAEYNWEQLSSGLHRVYPHLYTGPVYTYGIEEFEVRE